MCSQASIAPGAKLYELCFRKLSYKWKLISYQLFVLLITWLAYSSYHAAKKTFSVVKSELSPHCNVTTFPNNTCHPWEPFDSPLKSKDLFGMLDCAFLMAYALAMFVSGYIAEHTNLRIYLSIGMVLTGFFTAVSGMAYYWKIHSLSFFFLVQILTGVTQSTGWPCVVESVGSWFPKGRRGFIMGIWNTHVFAGNIVGAAIAGAFVDQHWGLSFIVPGIVIAVFGVVVFFALIPDPSHVNMVVVTNDANHEVMDESDPRIMASPVPRLSRGETPFPNTEEIRPIGIWGALKIPGVIEYSLCLFFAKLVSYTFLFWLPYYIESITIEGKTYTSGEAADWAILFDVGGAFGGILAGGLVDITHKPAIVNVVMLLIAGPCLFLLYFHGQAQLKLFICYMILSGFFVNGPYALITTAVSASLGTHECLRGNTKAMAVVTSIIDGTGSLGAAVGPLLAGVISSKENWGDVFYMLILADVLAAILLGRQFYHEIREVIVGIKTKMLKKCSVNDDDDDDDETKPLTRKNYAS